MVKFKKNSDDLFQRYVVGSRGNLLKVKSTIKPEECKIKRMTKDMRTYEPIYFELKIKD